MHADSQINLCASEVPLSPVFIDFLARWLDKSEVRDELWADQISERLINPVPAMRDMAVARLQRLMLDENAQRAIETVYRWLHDLMTDPTEALQELHSKFKFISVVGLGRTGGSYLTAELFSALGFDPAKILASIAHDGFPESQPFTLSRAGNQWVGTLLSTSEYLTMIGLYFGAQSATGRIVIPKKLTKGVYAGGLFNAVLGVDAEYIITVRHPIASCVSTYEKSGGLPPGGVHKTRSNLEKWIKRDLLSMGVTETELSAMDYFDAYVCYWEQYYINLAMSGLTANRSRLVIPYGKENMEAAAKSWHDRFANPRAISEFKASNGADLRHPTWLARSEEAIERVASVWRLAGLTLPVRELRECN
jgi:hypothetical protein